MPFAVDASAAGSIPNDPGTTPAAAAPASPALASAQSDRLTPLREMQLIKAHAGGDPDAMGTLLRSYQGRVYAVCYRMVPGAAADLTQDALVRVIEGIDSYSGRAAFSTWVIRIAMNCCLSHLRRERVRRHGSLDEPVGPQGEPRGARISEPAELSGPDHVQRQEMQGRLVRALADLEPAMRAAVVLRDLQGLDYQQIATVLDVAVGTVKSRLFRARAALRETLGETLESGSSSGEQES